MSEVTSDAGEFELADPGTILGQLQRGRGAGWLAAARSGDGPELLRSCLRHDPRRDRQVEDRADYYARLALELGLTAEDVDPDGLAVDGRARALGLAVVGRLAVRGDGAAVRRLRLERERPDDRSTAWEARRESGPPRDGIPLPKGDAPIAELLGFDWGGGTIPRAVRHRLRTTKDVSDVAALHEAAAGPWGPARRFAWTALAERRDPIAVDVAAEVFARSAVGAERASAFGYFLALDAEVTLPLAREWLRLDDGRSAVAAGALARHATAEDLPAIRAAFARAWAGQDLYRICSLVDALARLPAQAAHPELELVFTEVAYSYARGRATTALAAGDPAFATTYAVECLWDCEEVIRLTGAKAVDASTDLVKAGLARLAEDPHEEDDIRDAARERMGATG